jgi:hypothetical protein
MGPSCGNLSTQDLGFIYVSSEGRVGCEFIHPIQPTDAPSCRRNSVPFLYPRFNLVKIHLLFRIIPLIQWSVMFCRPCLNRFWVLKYIPRLFSEYMPIQPTDAPSCRRNSVPFLYPRVPTGLYIVCYTYFHWFLNPECRHIFCWIDQVFVTELTVVIYFCSCSCFEYKNSI